MHFSLPDFSACRVLVCGDVMLDRYWHGATARISPEAPVPVVQVRNDEARAGGAGNVALNAASLGAQARVVGLIGDDEAGRLLESGLVERGVHCAFERLSDAPTITKLRVISRHQQLIRLDFEERFDDRQAALVGVALAAQLEQADVLVLSDYAKGTLSDVAALIAAARARGVPVVVDPKGTDFSRYRGATIVKPNLAEFEAVVGPCPDDATLIARGEALRDELGLEALLVTRGEQGVTLLQKGQPAHHQPTRAQEVFDVTGAGDTVSAVLGCGIAAGLELRDATALANLAAGVVVGKLGTATASIDELYEAMNAHAPLARGLLAADKVLGTCQRAQAAGERIAVVLGPVGVPGADMLAQLEIAGKGVDRLLVIEPATAVAGAAAVLAALRPVDWVVRADDATRNNLLVALRPDVLFGRPAALAMLTDETRAAAADVRSLALPD
ncbi:MAG: D-glycero-beta-D-manno-heptose-7-phosphate kinase [Proteobacteria bacterium]|nr:D-glycero-beta-D-manno-heptose-7-phosphate kinase [Pseudomonadota bacterium]